MGRNYVIITLIRTPSKTFLQTISNSHISLLFLSLALASSDTIVRYYVYGRCCDTLPFSLRPLHSMEIEYWFLQINSIFFMDHIRKIRLN